MIEKPKNSNRRMAALPFMALWTGVNLGAWMVTVYFWLNYQYIFAPPAPHAVLVTALPGLIPAAVQVLLMKYALKKPDVNWWLPVSAVGYIASALSYYVYLNQPFAYQSDALRVASLFVPVALAQAAWLHGRVKNAWLWVVGVAISAVLFAMPLPASIQSDTMQYAMIALAALMQGLVTASVMRHLWTQEREKEKRALTLEEMEMLDREEALRLSRLRDAVQPDEDEIRHAGAVAKLIRR